MGFGYWIIPAVFFKIFGPFMFSLIKAQVFINIITLWAFRTLLRKLDVPPPKTLLSVVVFCLSYIFLNFWPWYNQSVIAFEIIASCFVISSLFTDFRKETILQLGLAAFFVTLSFFTKQDSGGLTLVIILGVLGYHTIVTKNCKRLLTFVGILFLWGSVFILPFIKYDLFYWFNYGQPPHTSRLELMDLAQQILGSSYWEKFYFFLIVILVVDRSRDFKLFIHDQKFIVFTTITLGILLQAMLIQVTSPIPPDNEVFYHGFAFAYLVSNINTSLDFRKIKYLVLTVSLVFFWWSGIYWRNFQKLFTSIPLAVERTIESKSTVYRVARQYKTLDGLFLAVPTIEGIERIRNLPIVKEKEDLKVLNMSELTTLAL